MKEDHRDIIRREFAKQAPRFKDPDHTVANPVYLEWMVDNLELESHVTVLDVGAGTGLLSRAMAPFVKHVVALDATQEMLDEGRRQLEQDRIENIVFEHGHVEHLPYPDNAFDLVVSRFAMHHFLRPHVAIAEMMRVCRPGGRVAVIDLVSPDDQAVAVTYNRLERMRDPAHARALAVGELRALLQEAGLDIIQTASRDVEVHVDRWFELTQTDPAARRAIVEELTQDLAGVRTSGMRPFRRTDELLFLQTWAILVGAKR